MEADGWKVLLVSTRRSAEKWVFPKGAIGRNERPKEAAIRETREVGRGGCRPRGEGETLATMDGGETRERRFERPRVSLVRVGLCNSLTLLPSCPGFLSGCRLLSVLSVSSLPTPPWSAPCPHPPSPCAKQEAGVTGTVGPKLGPFEIKAGHQVQKMWLLFVDTILGDDDPTWEERGIRERRWCAIEDAPKLLNPDKPIGYVDWCAAIASPPCGSGFHPCL